MDFANILTTQDKPVIIADEHGVVIRINAAFTEAFGWTGDVLRGRSLARIIPHEFREAHQMGFSRLLATGAATLLGQELDLDIVTAGGETLTATHFIMRGEKDDRPIFAALIVPR